MLWLPYARRLRDATRSGKLFEELRRAGKPAGQGPLRACETGVSTTFRSRLSSVSSGSKRDGLPTSAPPLLDPLTRPGWTSFHQHGTLLIVLVEPKRDRAAERREATRREIIDAAWTVAREDGLAQITLREVARRVGMRAPSLYSHFDSKHAIYDAMFADAWTECLEVSRAAERHEPEDDRDALKFFARTFFDFAVTDLARNQLMNQRTIPGFEPSPEAYAPAVAVLETFRGRAAHHGLTRPEDVDLYTALVGGLVDAQLANDPGGQRWSRLLDRAMDMYADNLGL